MPPTIRILFYTDAANISLSRDATWSVAEVSKFIKFKLKGLVPVHIDLINRHPVNRTTGAHILGGNKLTSELLARYDELWVFNKAQLGVGLELSTIELDHAEVQNLHQWMNAGGGVLLTGDHSSRVNNSDDHGTFVTLGRALGQKIPRAGQFRTWLGPPTADTENILLEKRDNFNTQEQDGKHELEDLKLQSDGNPQTLILENDKVPHELFRLRPRANGEFDPIIFFPDHAHEGELVIPKPKGEFWPANSPDPKIVAWGKDKRAFSKERFYPLVAVFEGNAVGVGVGRIVADSSFHHYVRPNLIGIPARSDGNPAPDTPLDQIAQFYANAAFWLAPKMIRDELQDTLLFRVAKHPDVFEVAGDGDAKIGNASRYVLNLEIGQSNLHQLFPQGNPDLPFDSEDELTALAMLGKSNDIVLRSDEHNAFLGAAVRRVHDVFASQGIFDPGVLKEPIQLPTDSATNPIREAFAEQDALLARLSLEHAEQLEKLL